MTKPICHEDKPYCFALNGRRCECLEKSRFKNACPFYKDKRTWDGYDEWREKYEEPIITVGGKRYAGTFN